MLTEVGVEEWPFIAATIEPAITAPSLDEVRLHLERRHCQAWGFEKNSGAAGYIITKTAFVKDTAVRAMWLLYASGKVFGPVRARMRAILRELEQRAAAFGEQEIRIMDGRVAQWRLVASDYDPIEGGLRKVLYG